MVCGRKGALIISGGLVGYKTRGNSKNIAMPSSKNIEKYKMKK